MDQAWRDDFFALVRETPNLQWLIVTKRIGNARKMLPHDFSPATFPNVTLIITVVNQEEADRDIIKLLHTPAAKRGLSIEPMLGPVDLERVMDDGIAGLNVLSQTKNTIDWVITGGESAQLKGKRELVPLEAEWVIANALPPTCRTISNNGATPSRSTRLTRPARSPSFTAPAPFSRMRWGDFWTALSAMDFHGEDGRSTLGQSQQRLPVPAHPGGDGPRR